MPERRHRGGTVSEAGSSISEPSLLLGQGESDALTRFSFSGAGKGITEAFSAGVIDVVSSKSMASLEEAVAVGAAGAVAAVVVVLVTGPSPAAMKGTFVNILIPVYVRE
jgi:hypothetical protein